MPILRYQLDDEIGRRRLFSLSTILVFCFERIYQLFVVLFSQAFV